jgi:hypothetical protein
LEFQYEWNLKKRIEKIEETSKKLKKMHN